MTVAGASTAPGLSIRRFRSRAEMADAAAAEIAEELSARLAKQDTVRVMFAAAPSQREMLASLIEGSSVDWSRVEAFHMDEYIGLPEEYPARFSAWLTENLFGRLQFKAAHLIQPDDESPQASAEAYARLLAEAPIDVVCLGIGVNGHLAFNDPPVADFDDPEAVKVVELDYDCRQQQVDDLCFSTLEEVPTHAVTVTIPTLLATGRLFCVAPGTSKRNAVGRALYDPIGPACPATALRLHPRCTIFLDQESDPDG